VPGRSIRTSSRSVRACSCIRVPWDDELRVLETKEALATVEEIPEESLV
jgi:hypothetical protein